MIFNNIFIRFKNKFRSFFNNKEINAGLIIFDDVFPNPLSDWRYNEFIFYLESFNNSVVISNITNAQFNKNGNHIALFLNKYPKYSNRVIEFNRNHIYNAKLGYCLFYNNLKIAFPFFKKHNIPFIFTLYPGGGFSIYDIEFEKELNQYFTSHLFHHVIVNMPHVYDYILNKFKIDSNKITLIYGVPINLPVIDIDANNNIDNKINILFSSHKYSSHGVDKGFDVFIRVAKVFEKDSRFTFSVIGGFNKGDMVVNAQNVAFIPELTDNQLAEKMKNYDIILSPNRSHVLHHGAFDGFPTGSVLHAVNSGCLMMITDDWDNSNLLGLIDGLDFIRISCSVMEIKQKLEHLANEPNKMKQIALNGKLKLKTLIDTNTQLERRMSIISSYL